MRSVTLSCITFQWMSTRVHWSFQAVGGQTFSPPIFEPVISTSTSVTCPATEASVLASIVAKPVLLARKPICFRLPSLSLYRSIICSTSRERKSPSPIALTDLMNNAPSPSLIHAVCVIPHLFLALSFSLSCLVDTTVRNAKTIPWRRGQMSGPLQSHKIFPNEHEPVVVT